MQQINAITNNRLVQKHGLKIVWALAILCLCWMLIHVGMNIYSSTQTRAANYLPQNIKPITKVRKAPYQVGKIVGADLFGDPSPVVVLKKAPKTTLDLTLQGILWASDDSIGMDRAIIQTGKKKSNLYSVGEQIKGAGAKIKEIREGEVILDRNGAAESLPLLKAIASGNRQIITYSNGGDDDFDAIADSLGNNQLASDRDSKREARRAASRDSREKTPSATATPRKVRKPNFSGLDRALKKLGEI